MTLFIQIPFTKKVVNKNSNSAKYQEKISIGTDRINNTLIWTLNYTSGLKYTTITNSIDNKTHVFLPYQMYGCKLSFSISLYFETLKIQITFWV